MATLIPSTTNAHPLQLLSNPIARAHQLKDTGSDMDGVPLTIFRRRIFQGSLLIQAQGHLLEQSQTTIAHAIVLFQRYFLGAGGGSFADENDKEGATKGTEWEGIAEWRYTATAALHIATKLSLSPIQPHSLVQIHALLCRLFPHTIPIPFALPSTPPPDDVIYLSHSSRTLLLDEISRNEAKLLHWIGYSIEPFVMPHALALTYLEMLEIRTSISNEDAVRVAKRVYQYLNSAMLSPQMLFVTQQPNVLAVAAIHLAERELGLVFAPDRWWEVVDVERDEMGFVVLSLWSFNGWVDEISRVSEEDEVKACE